MKKCIFLSLMLSIFGLTQAQNSYSIKVKIDGISDTTAYLSYFYAKGQYYKDTAKVNSNGEVHFTKVDTLEDGMYSVLIGESKLFDFMVDVQDLSFKTSKDSPINDMKVKGGNENGIFYEYLKFLNPRQSEASKLRQKQKDLANNEKGLKENQARVEELNNEVSEFLKGFHERNKGSLTGNFLKALESPKIPDAPMLSNGRPDSTFAFKYFRDHFFDNMDFSDERLLRTSAYHEKISYFVEKVKSQDPDSQIVAVGLILNKVKDNLALFKYTLSYFTQKYEQSKMMGMDAVFVHLAKNYYLKGKTDWLKDEQLKKIEERASALAPLLIGKKAPNIVVKDTAMKSYLQLYDVEAEYTIVYIWSPDCGHCKVATPQLKKLYDKYKSQGVEVFGVGNEFENEDWLKFIREKNLNWINGSDGGDFRSNFRDTYDVFSTPQTYLLDKNKIILSKKMNVESLEKMLEYFIQKNKNSK